MEKRTFKPIKEILICLYKILNAIKGDSSNTNNQETQNDNNNDVVYKPVCYKSLMTDRVVDRLDQAYDDHVDRWVALYDREITSNDENKPYLLVFASRGSSSAVLEAFSYSTNVEIGEAVQVTLHGKQMTLYSLSDMSSNSEQ